MILKKKSVRDRLKILDTFDISKGGIFRAIYNLNELPFLSEENATLLDQIYYYAYASDKYISNYILNLTMLIAPIVSDDLLVSDQLFCDEGDVNIKIAKYILLKYKVSWINQYNVLTAEYNPIDNYSMTETETPNLTRSVSSSENRTETPNLTTTSGNDGSTKNNYYGFNDSSTDGSSVNSSSANSTNTTTQTGNNKVDSSSSTTETNSGFRTLTRKGNIGVTTSQQMIESELELRKKQFFDIMIKDVDKIMSLSIY